MLASSSFDRAKLLSLYDRAYKVMVRAKGVHNKTVIDCLCDFIYFKKENVFYPYKTASEVSALYEQLLKAEEQVYGIKSFEVQESAKEYANFLEQTKNESEASRVQTTYHLNNAAK